MTVTHSPPGRVAVIQPLPGIGDMIWHLPHLKALAQSLPEGKITLITKPRSAADRLLVAEPAIEAVLWVDRNPAGGKGAHGGIAGLWRFIARLRAERFRRVVVLHHSWRYAFAAFAAGVPERYGYGVGKQRLWLNRLPYLSPEQARAHPIDQATAWIRAHGLALAEPDPELAIGTAMAARIAARFADRPRPWLALGLGSSEPFKQWGAERFAALARALLDRGWPSLFLIGGPAEAEIGVQVAAALGDQAACVVPVFDLAIDETAALIAACKLYVGNDTGVLNIAAAVGVPAIGLFGGTAPLTHSRRIHALTPPDGRPSPADGMSRITVAAVMEAIGRLHPSSF